MRDIAARCQINERTAHRIVDDLEEAGYLTHTRAGGLNHDHLVPGGKLRHPAEGGLTVDDLIALFAR